MRLYKVKINQRMAFLLLIFSVLMPVVPLSAQVNFDEYPFEISYFPFVQYDSNKLDYYGEHLNFNKFYARLDTLITQGRGQVNIVYVGGSHIQADMMTGELRTRFQRFNGGLNAGRGFLYPYKLAHTNTPWGYYFDISGNWKTCRNVEKNKICDLGMAGIMSVTKDSLSSLTVKMEPGNDVDYAFDRVRIYHRIDSHSFDIRIDSLLLRSKRVAADSGFTELRLNSLTDSLKIEIVKTDSLQTGFALFGLMVGNGNPGVMVHNFGINGAATTSFLRCRLFPEQLKTIRPDLVIFGLGINDAYGRRFSTTQYERNYDTLVRWVLQANPDAAIIFVTNNDSYLYRRYVNRNGVKVQQSMQRLARRHNAAVWDMFEIMGGLNSIVYWRYEGLAKKDKIHFTRPGYLLLGDLLFDSIIRGYGDYLNEQYIENQENTTAKAAIKQ